MYILWRKGDPDFTPLGFPEPPANEPRRLKEWIMLWIEGPGKPAKPSTAFESGEECEQDLKKRKRVNSIAWRYSTCMLKDQWRAGRLTK